MAFDYIRWFVLLINPRGQLNHTVIQWKEPINHERATKNTFYKELFSLETKTISKESVYAWIAKKTVLKLLLLFLKVYLSKYITECLRIARSPLYELCHCLLFKAFFLSKESVFSSASFISWFVLVIRSWRNIRPSFETRMMKGISALRIIATAFQFHLAILSLERNFLITWYFVAEVHYHNGYFVAALILKFEGWGPLNIV